MTSDPATPDSCQRGTQVTRKGRDGRPAQACRSGGSGQDRTEHGTRDTQTRPLCALLWLSLQIALPRAKHGIIDTTAV